MNHQVGHESLHCYRLAVGVARWVRVVRWPRGESSLRDQARRAADSVVLNIAEGYYPDYRLILAVAAFAVSATPLTTNAHVSVAGPGFANTQQILTFSIGHGCEGADTYRLEVDIPPEITSLRAMPGSFGEAEVTTDSTGLVTRGAWEKATVADLDLGYYQHSIRVRVPDLPFTTLYFTATQYCRSSDGTELQTEWSALPEDAKGEPAAALRIVPPRKAGWNTVPPELRPPR